jgi:hypothetical protein
MLSFKAQAALEYLTTYGWMILVLMVVAGALYYIGVFSGNTFSAKAQPGGCQVYRPYGPWTTQLITLQGLCSNLQPKTVGGFNGQSSYVGTGITGLPLGDSARTVLAWIYCAGSSPSSRSTVYGYGNYNGGIGEGAALEMLPYGNYCTPYFETDILNAIDVYTVPSNQWSLVGYTYAAGASSITFYTNDNQYSVGLGGQLNTQLPSSDKADIGKDSGGMGYNFNGSIADVQVYNTSLSANTIKQMYIEGIGGVPINLQNLVGWWPLNSDVNDYSGNGNNGAANSIAFLSNWMNGYVTP